MGGERLIELDEGPRIEAELSAQLPADPEQATAIVKRRLNNGGADLQRRIASAYQGVADAWSLGVTSIPAVVVDQRYVVYGEPDVAVPSRALRNTEAAAMTRPFERMRRLRAGVASVLLLSATGSYALNTATIVGSVASPDCLEYRVVGICYWLYCTWTGCTVRTSIKVRHYIPMRSSPATATPARTPGSKSGR